MKINFEKTKITIAGIGYVGIGLACLLSKKFEVTAFDIDKDKVDKINKKETPIKDIKINNFLKNKKLNLFATTDKNKAYKNCNFLIVATPTNYNIDNGSFDTSSVEQVIKESLKNNRNLTIIIKSTVPIGFTDKMRKKFKKSNIIFSPEFLREANALDDSLYPSRIIMGGTDKHARNFAEILIKCSKKEKSQTPVIFMSSKEAEAVKLFSNTYLAMRISFFNELDSFSEINNLSSENIINGVCHDHRIGNYYNNPSFGYGGYCLPKDTKQLLSNFDDTPNDLIRAVVDSNKTRKNFIVNSITSKSPKIIGIYRLVMKENSDNFRESAILDILHKLKKKKIKLILYEPFLKISFFNDCEVVSELNEFISRSDLIIANRLSKELYKFKEKIYSRDLFNKN